MKRLLATAVLSASLLSASAVANTIIEDKFSKLFPFEIMAIEDSPVSGVKQIVTPKGIYYATEDGEHFIQGQIYDFGEGFKNYTSERFKPIKANALEVLADDMVVYKAENEKRVISVFTDVTCGYCGRLHQSIPELNELGITVRYIAYPRSGTSGSGYAVNRDVWCADDKKAAFDAAFARQPVPTAVCDNKIDKMYKAGDMFNVRGTPLIVTDNLQTITGAQPPSQIAKTLGLSE